MGSVRPHSAAAFARSMRRRKVSSPRGFFRGDGPRGFFLGDPPAASASATPPLILALRAGFRRVRTDSKLFQTFGPLRALIPCFFSADVALANAPAAPSSPPFVRRDGLMKGGVVGAMMLFYLIWLVHGPSKPLFAFEFNLEAANKNFILLKCKFGGDLSEALLAQSDSPLGYGSEFKPIEMLEPIFESHPSWRRMKRILTHGSNKWPLQPLDKENRIKDVEDALNFGNHKGVNKQQELLEKLVTDDVIRGFVIPLPLSKITQIPGNLLAPLNIQAQNTINERGEIIPKNRLTHDQSWKWQSGTSVNSRVIKDELMPCYFGRAL